MIYPWQAEQWQHFQTANNAGHLAHALLLTGQKDCGKQNFAQAVAHSLLCESPTADGYACGQCKSCHVYRSGAHPDHKKIGLLDGKKDISISQIRELSQFLELSCSYGQHKVAIINDADRMNDNASNSLLKTLEEPPGDTVIILESSQPSTLSATIKSRCQKIIFPIPNQKDAIAWLDQQQLGHTSKALLSMAGGRPLLAKALDDAALLESRKKLVGDLLALIQGRSNHVELAKNWEKEDFKTLLNWQLSWVHDLLLINRDVEKKSKSIDVDKQLNQLALLLNATHLWNLYDSLLNLSKLATHPVNKILFAEKMLLIWLQAKLI